MVNAPDKLTALFAEHQAPAHDHAFTLDVLARIEQRQFRASLLVAVLITIAVGVIAWVLAPVLARIEPSATTLSFTGALFGVYLIWEFNDRRWTFD